MKAWLKEPLLHFVLLGAALFALDALREERTALASDDQIVVSSGRVANLAALFEKTWQRGPTIEELRGLVDDFVLEEALYREGKALGVDQNDTVIRRRVRQKMEFVLDDVAEEREASEAELEAWLTDRSDSYAKPGRYRFRQIFLSAERHGGDLDIDAKRVLSELRALGATEDPRGLGDPSLLEHAYPDASVQDVVAILGQEFADGLALLPVGEWSGPLESAFGSHLVFVDARSPGASRSLAEARDEVERDWTSAQRDATSKRFHEGILARYRVTIEWPEVFQQ